MAAYWGALCPPYSLWYIDTMKSDLERFWDKVSPEPNSGCWLWVASCNQKGYGRFWFRERLDSAHRASWVIFRGEIPNTLEVDHKCRVRCCVNPDHLELISHRENYIRGEGPALLAKRQASITHCPRGHTYSIDNTYVYGNSRRCRVCDRELHKTERYLLLKRQRRARQWEWRRGKI